MAARDRTAHLVAAQQAKEQVARRQVQLRTRQLKDLKQVRSGLGARGVSLSGAAHGHFLFLGVG